MDPPPLGFMIWRRTSPALRSSGLRSPWLTACRRRSVRVKAAGHSYRRGPDREPWTETKHGATPGWSMAMPRHSLRQIANEHSASATAFDT